MANELKARVLYDFDPADNGEVQLRVGEELTVIKEVLKSLFIL